MTEEVPATDVAEIVERPDLRPVAVEIQEPARFRALYRRNFSRALHAHAALEQFQLEVRGMRGRLAHFMSLLDKPEPVDGGESPSDPLQFLTSQDPSAPGFSEATVLGRMLDFKSAPKEPKVPLAPGSVIGRINSLNRRIGRLATIVKFARSQLNADTIPVEILPSPKIFASTYKRLDGLQMRELVTIQKEYAGLAHDVNNKLAIAMGNAQLMEFAKNLETLKSRLAGVQAALEQADVEIHAALDKRGLSNQVAQTLKSLAELKTIMGARIAVAVDSDIEEKDCGAVVGMASDHFTRVIGILTDNAQKVGAKNMNIRVRIVQDELVLSFKDNGGGFKGQKPEIAARASKEASAGKGASESTGNGLRICTELCRKAGGSLSLVDEKDTSGAEFIVRLPLLKARR